MYGINNIGYPIYYDYIFITIFLYMLWFIIFNHRLYVMTADMLSKVYINNRLEYKCLVNKGIIEHIYVRIYGYRDWYELDYMLCIKKGCGYNVYDDFVNHNNTSGKLLETMMHKKNDLNIKYKYSSMLLGYDTIRWVSLIFLTFFVVAFWYIYNNV